MGRSQFTFYESFAKAIGRIRNKEDRADAYDAICNYALAGVEPDPESVSDVVMIVFELIKPTMDSSKKKAEDQRRRRAEEKEATEPAEAAEPEKKAEEPQKAQAERSEPEADMPPAAAQPATASEKTVRKKYGKYRWVKLSEQELESLRRDLGDDEVKRCITYIDESAQANSNKNGWQDWNVVIRKCSRDGWGIRGYNAARAAPEEPSCEEGNSDDYLDSLCNYLKRLKKEDGADDG